jgi:hypothetical protein
MVLCALKGDASGCGAINLALAAVFWFLRPVHDEPVRNGKAEGGVCNDYN